MVWKSKVPGKGEVAVAAETVLATWAMKDTGVDDGDGEPIVSVASELAKALAFLRDLPQSDNDHDRLSAASCEVCILAAIALITGESPEEIISRVLNNIKGEGDGGHTRQGD